MITGVVLTHNEEQNITSCVEHLRPHVAELILIDTESTDRTVEIARPLVDRILTHPHVPNFDSVRNLAIPEARYDWMWFVDADEHIPALTGQIVNQWIRERGDQFEAISIPFKSYFCGQWSRHSPWWPGYTGPRVLKRGHFEFSPILHGGVALNGRQVSLGPDERTAVDHFSFRDIEHWIEKFNRYTSTEAQQLAERGAVFDWRFALRRMVGELWDYYEQHEGRLDGERGWILAWCAGQYQWFCNSKLIDLDRTMERNGGISSVPASLDEFLAAFEQELAALRAVQPTLPLGIVWRAPVWEASRGAAESRRCVLSLAVGKRRLSLEDLGERGQADVPVEIQALLNALLRCRRDRCVLTMTQATAALGLPDPYACHNTLRVPSDVELDYEFAKMADRYDEVCVESDAQITALRSLGVAPERMTIIPSLSLTDSNDLADDESDSHVESLILEAERRFEKKPAAPVDPQDLRVAIEGEFFVGHSFSNINETLASRLSSEAGLALSIHLRRSRIRSARKNLRSSELQPYIVRNFEAGPEVTIRHAFPPNLQRPSQGKWVHIQPWEFGYLPQEWVEPLRDQADEIWAMSRYVEHVYLDSGIPREKLHYIPWGIDPDIFDPEVIPRQLPTDKTFRFLYVGGAIARKGFDRVLEAFLAEFTEHDDVCLVVKAVGTESFYHFDTLRNEIVAAQQSPSKPSMLVFEGDWTPGQLASLYAACHCFVAPYRGEGFGLPVLEALACGLPAIVPRGGPTDDFVNEECGFLLPSMFVPVKAEPPTCGPSTELHVSIDDLRAAMRQAYSDRERTSHLGQVGSEQVRRNFTWDHTIRLIRDRLKALAGKNSPRQDTSDSTPVPTHGHHVKLAAIVRNASEPAVLVETLARVEPFVDELIVHAMGDDQQIPDLIQEYGATQSGPHVDAAVISADWCLTLDPGEYLLEEEFGSLRAWLAALPDGQQQATFAVPAFADPPTLGAPLAESRLKRQAGSMQGEMLVQTATTSAAAVAPFTLRRVRPLALRTKRSITSSPASNAGALTRHAKNESTPTPSGQDKVDETSSDQATAPTYGRLMKSLLVQMATGEHLYLLSLTRDHHRRYAERHGMDYWCIAGNPTGGKRASWGKIPLLLAGISLGYESVIWLDADAVIVRPEINLGELGRGGIGMVRHPNPEHWNAGFIVAHATPLVERLLQRIDASPENDSAWMEQVVVNELSRNPEFAGIFRSLDLKFNTVPGVFDVQSPVIVAGHGLPFPHRRAILVKALAQAKAEPAVISEWRVSSREQFGELLNRLNLLGEAVEVGVYRGEYSECLLAGWQGRMLHLVDSWRHLDNCRDITNASSAEHEANLEATRQRLAPYVGRFRIHRQTSREAVTTFADGSLDFVYLDANHAFGAVWDDLHLWYPKVSKGGIFAGHDFRDGELPEGSFGVETAVRAFEHETGLKVELTDDPWISWYVRRP